MRGPQALGGANSPPGRDAAYSCVDSVLQKLGHTMYGPATIEANVQLMGTPGDLASWTAFHNFVVNVQQFECTWPCSGVKHISP